MLSKTSIQAIRAVIELAKLSGGQHEGAVSIAKKIKAPQNYLGKLLQTLSYDGLVVSQKGMGGGFRLGKDPRKITLFEIVELMEDLSRWSGCVLGNEKCSDQKPCAAHNHWKGVREGYLKFLSETTIADLMR